MKRPLYYSVYLAIALSMTGFAFANNSVTVNISNSVTSGLITKGQNLALPNFNPNTNEGGWWNFESSTALSGPFTIQKGDANYDPSRQFGADKAYAVFEFSYPANRSVGETIYCEYNKNFTPTKTLQHFWISIDSGDNGLTCSITDATDAS